MEADLLRAGFGRGVDEYPRRLNLRTLHSFAEHARPDSCMFRVVHGEPGPTTTDELLRLIHHALAGANWQRGGGKGDPPKPLVWPGEDEPDTNSYGDPVTPADFHAMYQNA